jgi:lysozyme
MIYDIIKKYEGLRLKPYRCPAGKLTIGYGFNLDNGITEEMADELLEYGVSIAMMDLNKVFGPLSDLPGFNNARYIALIDMMFNMGKPTFLKFRKMITSIKQGDWEKAADELVDSDYYKQVGQRAKDNEARFRGKTQEIQ